MADKKASPEPFSVFMPLINCIIDHHRNPTVPVRWVPAHQGIAGNERARHLAPQGIVDGPECPPSTLLRSSALAQCKEIVSKQWRKTFEASNVGESTRKLDCALAHFHTKKLYDQLSCKEASAIAQLRTSKASLNEPLYKIKRAESSACDCGAETETVKHFLLECPRWMDLRAKLQTDLGSRFGDLAFMLGGWSGTKKPDGRYMDGPPEKWRAGMRAVKETVAFALATGRLIATKRLRAQSFSKQIDPFSNQLSRRYRDWQHSRSGLEGDGTRGL